MEDQGRDIVVIGASAGGVEALQSLVQKLPADLPAAVLIVLHLSPKSPSMLPAILNGSGRLPAAHAVDGEPLTYSRVYVAPPDRHLLVTRSNVRVVRGPKENRHRPSIDVLFRSAALGYGPRVTAAILTGADDDGTAGSRAVQQAGGVVLVQDPAESAFPIMPRSALQHVGDARCLKLADIPGAIATLAREAVPASITAGDAHPPMAQEVRLQENAERETAHTEELGTPSAFGCPECGGTLWELGKEGYLRFRCRVGHAYTPDSLIKDQEDVTDRALWSAVRALEESAAVARRLAKTSDAFQEHYLERAREREGNAAIIRRLLTSNGPVQTP
jgi:two-component system chemotaxis response regulator CheB